MAIAGWIIVGAIVGALTDRIDPARLPGGIWASTVCGMAGGFIGGGTVSLLTGHNGATIDATSMLVAIAAAGLLAVIVRRAAHTQPRTDRRTR